MNVRTPLLVAAAIFALTAQTNPNNKSLGGASFMNVTTKNATKYEAWVDISWSYIAQGWHIEKAFCLKPGDQYEYRINYKHPLLFPTYRVRAEIKLAGCARGTHAVVSYDDFALKTRENVKVTINEHTPDRFSMNTP